LSQHHQQAVLNLAHIEKKRIRDILLPWKEVNFVRFTDTMEDVVPVILASGHTRLPVIRDSLVEGILHTKELLAFREAGNKDWRSIIRPSLSVSPQDSVLNTLRMMQTKRNHMAIVVDQGGEPLGAVTMEDISEEIWGDIYDEDDDGRIRRLLANRVKDKITPPRI
ncbi:MAG: CBS domain-containing protein, partial [Burkholderiaceae bacterium]|nr:CBS domain-containing protein [Burkholderiaceae bacterium]